MEEFIYREHELGGVSRQLRLNVKCVNVGRSIKDGCLYRILKFFLLIVDVKASINNGAYKIRTMIVVIMFDLLAVKAIISSLNTNVNPQAKIAIKEF